MAELPITERTRVRRIPARGVYDRETIDAILDEGLIAHVGMASSPEPSAEGASPSQPFVIPMVYARLGDTIYLHGSPGSRLLRALAGGAETTLCVTLVDALVLARSGMHHSMNYRSVVVFGRCAEVTEEAEKRAALDRIVEHVIPGRTRDARGANDKELRQTMVVGLPLNEASAKIRSGPPKDDDEDLELDVWAGLIPLRTVAGDPVDAPDLVRPIPQPEYVRSYSRP